MIVPLSSRKYALVSPHSGRVLGTHRSAASAKRQERAINIAKARAAGHFIPYRRARRSRARHSR